jgi:diphosphoinositol-polyphosphate diphosphatase
MSSRLTLILGYGDNGERLVAGVVAISADRKKVLVVESTTRNNHWVLPKGGYETDEATPQDAAARMV